MYGALLSVYYKGDESRDQNLYIWSCPKIIFKTKKVDFGVAILRETQCRYNSLNASLLET